jgi:perosamine synthetase
VHDELGFNFRMTNMQAAVGLAQLEQLDQFVEKKRLVGRLYDLYLSDETGIQLPLHATDYAQNNYWVYGIVLNDNVPFDADVAIKMLANKGIGCRPFFWCMHEQPVLKKMGLFNNESYPIAERLARRGFYLPSGMALTGEQIDRSAQALKEILS